MSTGIAVHVTIIADNGSRPTSGEGCNKTKRHNERYPTSHSRHRCDLPDGARQLYLPTVTIANNELYAQPDQTKRYERLANGNPE